MFKEDLGFVAEALLALCEQDRKRPFFSEDTLDKKLQRDERRAESYDELAIRLGDDELVRGECRDIFAAAHLTVRQAEVLDHRLDGWTFEEIGGSRGVSKQGAQRVFVQALKKLAKSHHVYPYAGLGEVYRDEVRRGLPPTRRR